MLTNASSCEFVISYYYDNITGYVDVSLCFIGVILNVLNMLVFSRKNMASPANVIFTHLAIADLLILSASIPPSWLQFVHYEKHNYKNATYAKAVIHVCCMDLRTTLTFTSVYLTLMLAIWRYIAVAHPLKERDWCNMKTTRNSVIAGYIVGVLLSIPRYFSFGIEMYSSESYYPDYKENSILRDISYLIRALLQRFLPSVVLLIFSIKLIATLLKKGPSKEQPASSSNAQNNARNLKIKQQTDRSIIITLIVVALYLIEQISKGLNHLRHGSILKPIYSKFNSKCLVQFEDAVDTLSYFNMSITFVVYYAMSRNFRTTFKSLFNSNITSLRISSRQRTPDSSPETGPVVINVISEMT
ncbi:sex peptide receptor-like [Planococcus citri]|uniref:sex peptide receptor-like n=1 Tax=Planococcus citri TaxID=170843 RepID=UPI0031F9A32A